jgi:hypothetical protein
MRFTGVALAAFAATLFIGANAYAQGVIVSTFNCQQVPCDQADPSFPPGNKIVSDTAQCVSQNLPVSAENVFRSEMGLGNNNCLTTNMSTFSGGKQGTSPQCCIKKLPVGICIMHCDMVAQ